MRGCVAVERGPLVYCAESVGQDPAARLDAIAVDTSTLPADHGHASDLDGAVRLRCSASPVEGPEPDWPTPPTPTASRRRPSP